MALSSNNWGTDQGIVMLDGENHNTYSIGDAILYVDQDINQGGIV